MSEIVLSIANFLSIILTSLWFWIFIAFVILWRILTVWYRRCKLKALERVVYSRSFSSDGVFAGETFEFTETISNPSLFPLFSVKMEYYMPSGFTVDGIICKEYTKMTSIFHIPPRASVKKTHSITANERGHAKLETASIRYRNTEFSFSVPYNIYVYPNYSAIKNDLPPDIYRAGDNISHQKNIEDPFFLSCIRPYQAGDSMRTINFKASVRSFSGGVRQLMCNSFDSSRNFNSLIILDMFNYSTEDEVLYDNRSQLEIGLCYACYLLLETVRQGGRVGYASNCTSGGDQFISIPCGFGDLHIKNILNCFATTNYYSRRDFSINSLILHCLKTLPPDTDIYLITPFTDSKTADTIHRIESKGVNVCIIKLNQGGNRE